MHGVECGPERRPVPQEALYHLAARKAWAFQCEGIEFLVSGSPREPHRDRLELAERVAARIEAFEAEADEYLAGFVDTKRIKAHRPWRVESFEFGVRRSDAADEFEMLMVLEGDTYGVWGVRFRPGGALSVRFYPIEFRRRQT
jgi:hypothetical protein